jgi:hypothetical protein
VSTPDRIAFVLKLARAMLASGYAAHRLVEAWKPPSPWC